MAVWHLVLPLLLLGAGGVYGLDTDAGRRGPSAKQLKRSTAKRWDNIHEIVRSEIKSATKKFLQEREKSIVLPIEVDILLLGFDEDGGYGYGLNRQALEEMLGTATADNTICPTVWETGESSAVCFSVNYLTLDNKRLQDNPIQRIERVLTQNMDWVGDRSQDWPDGSREVQVYEVEASGEVEATYWDLLDEAYGGMHPEVSREQHNQIVIVNPSKLRMRPVLPRPATAGPAPASNSTAPAPTPERFMEEWKKGTVNSSHVVEQEAGFLYRYKYNGRGAAASFVGQYNFVVIDVSAGPVSFGPLASPGGAVAPAGMPRLLPLLLRMTKELESHPQVGTLRAHLLEEASSGQSALLVGQLASAVASATRHLFASDVLLGGTQALAERRSSRRVVVPIVVLQDHVRDLEYEGDGSRGIDTDMVQLALDELLPPDMHGAVAVSRYMLSQHTQIAAALVKARHSRSEAVLAEPPDTGLHKAQTVSLDSGVLLRELRLSQDELISTAAQHLSDDYSASLSYMDDPGEFLVQKHRETKVVPVFVFSLERAPEQMLFDNHQLVAAGHDIVMVLQLLGNPSQDHFARGRVYSGHMQEGHHLLIDASESPTRAIVAGLATALGGIVPPHQRYCQAEHAIVEDWRWAVGAVPWGPYSNYTALSSIFSATAHRNLIVARIEESLRLLTDTMDKIDAFVAQHLMGPYAYLRKGFGGPRRDGPPQGSAEGEGPGEGWGGLGVLLPHHHLLDDLARQHTRYVNTSATLAGKLRSATHKVRAAARAAVPAPAAKGGAGQGQGQQHEAAPHGGMEGEEAEHYDGEEEEDEDDEPEEQQHEEAAHPAAVDLVEEQPVLSPNVAQRLQGSLDEIGSQLEQISFMLYSRNWAELDEALPALRSAVEEFASNADRDLQHGHEVVACCAVRHVPAGSGTWFVVGAVVTALGSFGILALVALRQTALYRPNRLATQRSLSRGRSLSGQLQLPTWSSSGPSSPLPR